MSEAGSRCAPPQMTAGRMDYYPQIQRLCDERYGTGYIDRGTYERWMEHPELMRVALIEGAFAGFSVFVPASVEALMAHMAMPREDAAGLGYGSIFGSAWVYDGKIPMSHLFDHFGFRQLYGRKLLWYHEENYRCVVCGGRCRCDAMIYYKKL